MSKQILTVKIEIPTYDGNYNPDEIHFGNILSTKEDIIKYFLSFDENKKQELFRDYKECIENIHNNRVESNLGNIDARTFLLNEKGIITKVKEKYKIDINKLIKLFFNKPLNNAYEYNLSRGIEQNFTKIRTTYTTSQSDVRKVDTKYLVYEINKFTLNESNFIINELSFIEI